MVTSSAGSLWLLPAQPHLSVLIILSLGGSDELLLGSLFRKRKIRISEAQTRCINQRCRDDCGLHRVHSVVAAGSSLTRSA